METGLIHSTQHHTPTFPRESWGLRRSQEIVTLGISREAESLCRAQHHQPQGQPQHAAVVPPKSEWTLQYVNREETEPGETISLIVGPYQSLLVVNSANRRPQSCPACTGRACKKDKRKIMEQKILRGSCQESICLIVKNDKKEKTLISMFTYEIEGRVTLCNKGNLSFSLVIFK